MQKQYDKRKKKKNIAVNIRPGPFEQFQANEGKALQDISIANNSLNSTVITQEIIGIMDKWDCIKFSNFCI
jgi:hypothetical protein